MFPTHLDLGLLELLCIWQKHLQGILELGEAFTAYRDPNWMGTPGPRAQCFQNGNTPLLKLILKSTSQLTHNTQDGVCHSGPSRYLKQHTNLRYAQSLLGGRSCGCPRPKSSALEEPSCWLQGGGSF